VAPDLMSTKHHFRLAYAVLALAFWLSVAGFIVLLTRQHNAAAVRWSAWHPTAQGLDGAHQIAERVGPTYKSTDGTQLAAVQEALPFYQGERVAAVGVRRLAPNGQIAPYIGVFPTDKTLIYAFCGLDANCSVQDSSTAGQQRTLRREALELSLYAFKYLKNVDQVVSLVETVKGGGTNAVFLQKQNLKPELEHPLRDTLPLSTPPLGADPRESAVIDALTQQNTFPAHYETLPDGDAILVLDIGAQATG
jgi:hypothetical protein